MTGGTICAVEKVTIGHNVTIGANTIITDSDFYPLDLEAGKSMESGGKSAAVSIGDGAFIGMNCLVLKGVRIGKGSVIGAGSVVTRDVPPGMIVAGNPARPLSEISRG